MAPRRRRLPSFYVILLDRIAPHLPLPAGFVRKHLANNIPEDPILLSDNGGHSWSLKIKKDGDIYCFADGWNDVVEDSLLEFGDFLLFKLIDQSTFKLSVFGPNGCAKMFPQKTQVEDDGHDEDEVAETREEEVEEEVEYDDDEEVEEDDNYDDEEEDEEEDEDEETDEEEEGGEEEDENNDEEEEDDINDEKEEDDEDEDSGGDIDGNDGDPFFMKKISKTHLTSMWLPMGFARLAGLDEKRSIMMKNLEGEEWSMSILPQRSRQYTRYIILAGWAAFMRANNLSEGDTCAFKFLRSEDKLCLAKVTKKRVTGQQSAVKAPATKGKDNGVDIPVVEVLRRSRRPPPCVEVVEKKGRGKRPAGKVFMRTRGKRRHVEVESKDDRQEVVKRKTRAAGKAPVTEVLKRLRGRPQRVEERKAPMAEVSKRKRGRPFRVEVESKNKGEKVVKRGRWARVKVVDGKNDGEKVVTRSRGRPFKRSCVGVDSKNEDAKVVKRGRWPSRVVVESKKDGEKVEKRQRGRTFKKRGRGRQPK